MPDPPKGAKMSDRFHTPTTPEPPKAGAAPEWRGLKLTSFSHGAG
jgi:hypothetical protein